MVDFTTANNALKTVYLGVLSDVLNLKTNPLFAKIKQSSKGVYGKEIKVLAPVGVNGGICATGETDELPRVTNGGYVNLTSTLKNLYGRIEISDKAIRASQSSAGAFVNLLNDEMERLIEASTFNLSRMLYGDGRGLITEISSIGTDKKTFTVKNAHAFVEGMVVELYDNNSSAFVENGKNLLVTAVDRASGTVKIDKEFTISDVADGGYYFVMQNSFKNEITGVDALFNAGITTLYGLAKANYPFIKGRDKSSFGTMTEIGIISEIDTTENNTGAPIDFISCSPKVRRKYQSILIDAKRPIQTMDIEGGFKALDFYGKPLVSDRLIKEDTMYLLNTKNFALHQLCDWEWMSDESGNILTQKAGYAAYTATLVKYADLICTTPYGQARLSGITLS